MSNTQQAESVSTVPGAYEVNGAAVGTIRILDGAISTIVKRTVLGIEGVARLSGSSLIDDFADLVRSKRMQDRSIQIEHKDDSIAITVAVNPYFGYKFPALIAEIQKKVSKAVLDMTGIKVASVSVVTVNQLDVIYSDCTATLVFDTATGQVETLTQIMHATIQADARAAIISVKGTGLLINTMKIYNVKYK